MVKISSQEALNLKPVSLNVKQIYSCSTEIPETLTLKGLFSGNVIIKMILRWKNVYTMEEKI